MTKTETGIFWDYENVPLQKNNWEKFLIGLKNFLKNIDISFAKIYYRENQIKEKYKDGIKKHLQGFKLHQVKRDEPNSVDKSLMNSLLNAFIEYHPNMKQILLISGDSDFSRLINNVKKWDCKIVIISRKGNMSKKLVRNSDSYYFMDMIANNPKSWWKQKKEVKNKKLPEKISNQDKKYKCKYCNRKFNSLNSLNQHLRSKRHVHKKIDHDEDNDPYEDEPDDDPYSTSFFYDFPWWYLKYELDPEVYNKEWEEKDE